VEPLKDRRVTAMVDRLSMVKKLKRRLFSEFEVILSTVEMILGDLSCFGEIGTSI
jgi:hypothetical protein